MYGIDSVSYTHLDVYKRQREFRAAWIQSVNGQFRGMPTEKLKQNLIGQLNSLQKEMCIRDRQVFVLWLVLRKKEALQRKRFEEDNKQP